MTDDFKFSDLVKPGAGSRQVLERELTARREREQQRRKPGYRYGGAADLVLAHGEWFTGRELPDQYRHLIGSMTMCHRNTLNACLSDPALRYFTGFYMAGTEVHEHSWVVAPDGGVLELTLADTKAMQETGLPPSQWTMAARRGASPVPWLPPERRAYVGVEYDPAFIAEFNDKRGLPVLVPNGYPPIYYYGEELPMFKLQYDKAGFEVTEPDDELVQAARDDGQDWLDDEDYDPEEPEFA